MSHSVSRRSFIKGVVAGAGLLTTTANAAADKSPIQGFEDTVSNTEKGREWAPISDRKIRVGIVGSGPAGMACAADMAKAGCEVVVYEAFHEPGGVLKYGIPEFRLPDAIIDVEIENLKKQGVEIRLDTVVGKIFTIPQLISDMGYNAVFIATGAGSPKFMGIPGESLNGVFSANEFLTRVNLMRGYQRPLYDTPVGMGKRVAVIGAGNTAMDAMRVSLRMGAEKVYLVYRRSIKESPARAEELHHAIQEGVIARWLTNPVRILGNQDTLYVGSTNCAGPDGQGCAPAKTAETCPMQKDCKLHQANE